MAGAVHKFRGSRDREHLLEAARFDNIDADFQKKVMRLRAEEDVIKTRYGAVAVRGVFVCVVVAHTDSVRVSPLVIGLVVVTGSAHAETVSMSVRCYPCRVLLFPRSCVCLTVSCLPCRPCLLCLPLLSLTARAALDPGLERCCVALRRQRKPIRQHIHRCILLKHVARMRTIAALAESFARHIISLASDVIDW